MKEFFEYVGNLLGKELSKIVLSRESILFIDKNGFLTSEKKSDFLKRLDEKAVQKFSKIILLINSFESNETIKVFSKEDLKEI